MTDVKEHLLGRLHLARGVMLAKLEGLSEYDRRRPMTPTGTNLLGLVKHLAGIEYEYLGQAFGRPPVEVPSWFATTRTLTETFCVAPHETTEYIVGVYRQVCTHADATVAQFDLDSPGHVAQWPAGNRDTTLGVLLVRVVGETAQHAGHADIIRELIDGGIGAGRSVGADAAMWRDVRSRVQAAADHFRDG